MSDVRELLDRLDGLRVAACNGDRRADAALIFTAVNKLPELVAVLRAALDLDATITDYMLGDVDGGAVAKAQHKLNVTLTLIPGGAS